MDFTIYDIIRFYRRRSRLLLALFVGIFLVTVSIFLLSTKQYQASLEMLPPDTRMDGLSAATGGSLAQALMGGGSTNPDFANFLASMGSIQLAERLLTEPKIAQTVFIDRWDAEQKRWKPSSSPVAMVGRVLRFVFGMKAAEAPTPFEMRAFVLSSLDVSKNSDSRSTRLSFRHYDPAFARLFLSQVIREQDEILRKQKLSVYEKENAALRERFNGEQSRGVQEYMIRWISENESKIVKAESAEYFSFQVLDPISVTVEPVSPQPLLSVVISFIAALLGSLFILAIIGFARLLVRASAAP